MTYRPKPGAKGALTESEVQAIRDLRDKAGWSAKRLADLVKRSITTVENAYYGRGRYARSDERKSENLAQELLDTDLHGADKTSLSDDERMISRFFQ